MEFFGQAIEPLKVLVVALGGSLGVWEIFNLFEDYGTDKLGEMLMCYKITQKNLIDNYLENDNFLCYNKFISYYMDYGRM